MHKYKCEGGPAERLHMRFIRSNILKRRCNTKTTPQTVTRASFTPRVTLITEIITGITLLKRCRQQPASSAWQFLHFLKQILTFILSFTCTSRCFSPLSTVPFFFFHRTQTCVCLCVCACVRCILFSDLSVSQVNNWCFRSILKPRSVRLSAAGGGGAHSPLAHPRVPLWAGGTQRRSQKPSVRGRAQIYNCECVCVCLCSICSCYCTYVCALTKGCVQIGLYIYIYICLCVCAHVCVCMWLVHSITQSTMESESHPVWAENNKTTGWQKSSAAGNRPQGERNTNTHAHTHMYLYTHTHTERWSVSIFHKQRLFISKKKCFPLLESRLFYPLVTLGLEPASHMTAEAFTWCMQTVQSVQK